jgi:hypothetical protein
LSTYLNNNQAYLTGNQLRAVGLGRAAIKAYLDGNDSLYYAESVQRFFIDRAKNVTEMTPIPDLQEGQEAIPLGALATSGLEAAIKIVDGPARIADYQLIPQGSGRVELIATEPGNATYAPADTVRVSFCVLPSKPSIRVVNDDKTVGLTLMSSRETGNQWYYNGSRLPDEGPLLTPRQSGQYTLQIGVDSCFSEFSEALSITITGLEEDAFRGTIRVYPIPFQERLTIERLTNGKSEAWQITLSDVCGRAVISQPLGHLSIEEFSTATIPAGIYLLKIMSGQRVTTFKVVKQP